MNKSFFVHCNKGTGKLANRAPRGFTAYIAPNTEDNTGRTVKLGLAFCSPKDQFCKRTGRDTAMAVAHKVVNKRDVPTILGTAQCKVFEYESIDPGFHYLYTLKYMI